MNKYCKNCNMVGHNYYNCKKPITSHGIILVNTMDNVRKYLLIQRKNSISFLEFIFGKYSLENYNYIKNIFNKMSHMEVEYIKTMPSYTNLWKKVYNTTIFNINMENKYNICLSKYNICLFNSSYKECEWELPKGRRNNNESDYKCAIREFHEETNIDINDISVQPNNQYIELYRSTNNIKYLHVYYLATLKYNIKLNKKECKEVNKIKWCTYDECIQNIRSYSTMKLKVIHDVENHLKELSKQITIDDMNAKT